MVANTFPVSTKLNSCLLTNVLQMYNSPYKPVPPPKPLGGNAPPYRVPPPFGIPGTPGRLERHPVDPGATSFRDQSNGNSYQSLNPGNGVHPGIGPAPTVVAQQECGIPSEHYHTHSSKFPVSKELLTLDRRLEKAYKRVQWPISDRIFNPKSFSWIQTSVSE